MNSNAGGICRIATSISQTQNKMTRRKKSNSATRATRPTSVGYLVRYAYRSFIRTLTDELAPHGIGSGQWSVLRVLWEEEGLSQVELAEQMRVEKASLTSVLDSMDKNGLIKRTRDTKDRRKINIYLSARGRTLKKNLFPKGVKVNRKATRGMSVKEIAELRRLLTQAIDNLGT